MFRIAKIPRTRFIFGATSLFFGLAAYGLQKKRAQASEEILKAICEVKGTGVQGIIRFSQPKNGLVKIEGEVSGLKSGNHGFHVHEKGDLTQGCASAGPHFNPLNKKHGSPKDQERHVGDLGNITVTKENVPTKFVIEDHLIQLQGPFSVIGRSAVIHADEDDLGKGSYPDSATTGHSGARVACGIIGVA